jgi:very-long-chain (3R)-3-hydroxyacyl-CoA dehydratase
MSDTATSSSAAAARPASNSLKANYLLGYNAVSMFSWLSLLWHAGLSLKVGGLEYVHPQVDIFWKVTQSLAVLEIVHSAFGRPLLSCLVCLGVISRAVMWIC